MLCRGEIGKLVVIDRIRTDELSVKWQVPNVLSLPGGICDFYQSPDFNIADECWYLSLRPNCNREAQDPASGWVGIDLCRWDAGPPKAYHFSVGIRGFRRAEVRLEREQKFSSSDDYAWNYLCSRSELLEHKTRLMLDGCFNITCVLKRLGANRDIEPELLDLEPPMSLVAKPSHSTDENSMMMYVDQSGMLGPSGTQGKSALVSTDSQPQGCEKAHKNIFFKFAELFDSGENSNVTVQVDDTEFKVHSFILLARSPALSGSLRHECKEKASNRIVIEDCESDVFHDFLHHLYLGSVQFLTEQNAFSLYRVADKYLVDDLKQQCLEQIQKSLSVQTFCDTIILALMYGESDLLKLATDFALKNMQSILISRDWQNFTVEHPRQAEEILSMLPGFMHTCKTGETF